MCDFLSGWVVREAHRKWQEGDVVVRDPVSHCETARIANLDADKANEWEWTRDDPELLTVRRRPDDPHGANWHRACVLSHGDTRLDFLNWLFGTETFQNYGGGLYLNGLTSAEGLTLPSTIGGGLSLDGLTSAEGLTLPSTIGGRLYLNGLTSAERGRLLATRGLAE